MANNALPHTTEFIASLAKYQESLFDTYGDDAYNVYADVPECLVDQARGNALPRFQLDKDLVSNSVYTGQRVSETDLFRIVIEEPKETEGGIQFKVRLSGNMDYATGDMIPFNPANRGAAGSWIKGFRSGLVIVTEEDVQNGFMSEDDYNVLKAYTKMWAELVAKLGPNGPYTKGNGNMRLWLTAANEDFLFTFNMELRKDPKSGQDRIGLYGIEWSNGTFIGSGTNQTPARLGKASRQQAVHTNVKVAGPFRPTQIAEDDSTVPSTSIPARRSAKV